MINVPSKPPNMKRTDSTLAQKDLIIIHNNKTSKKQNMTENYVANILSPTELLLSTAKYTLKFPKIICTPYKKSKALIGSKLYLQVVKLKAIPARIKIAMTT